MNEESTDFGHTHLPTATVLDITGGGGFLGVSLVRRAGSHVIGRALTAQAGAGDNLALHRAVERAAPGDVLVLSCPGPPVGLAGEIICTALRQLGAGGFVTDSGVRDLDRLVEIGLPVWSAGVNPVGTAKVDPGSVGDPLEVGGVRVSSGDIIVADGDGVVCVPRDTWPHLLEALERKQETEARWLADLRQGERLGRITGLINSIDNAGTDSPHDPAR